MLLDHVMPDHVAWVPGAVLPDYLVMTSTSSKYSV
jgi:hypothetical protein